MPSDSALTTVVSFAQLAFLIAGLVVLISSLQKTAEWSKKLDLWNISGTSFAVLCILGFAGAAFGGFGGGVLSAALPEEFRNDKAFDTFLRNAAMHAGILGGLLVGLYLKPLLMPPLAGMPQDQPIRLTTSEGEPEASSSTTKVLYGQAAALFLATVALLTGVALGWQWLLERFGVQANDQELVTLVASTRDPLKLTLMALTATVLAPVTEELIFRAGIFRFLLNRVPRWLAYVLSAAAFAALHQNVGVLLPLFVFGLLFSFAYERTGRIEVTMLAHGMFNLNTLAAVMAGLNNTSS